VNSVEVAEYDTTVVSGLGHTRLSVKVVPDTLSWLDSVALSVPPSKTGKVTTSLKHPPVMTTATLPIPGGGPPSHA